MNMCTKRTSDLTEGEDRQCRLHPFGDLRVIPHVDHHLQVRQPVDHLQDEMFHTAAPEAGISKNWLTSNQNDVKPALKSVKMITL